MSLKSAEDVQNEREKVEAKIQKVENELDELNVELREAIMRMKEFEKGPDAAVLETNFMYRNLAEREKALRGKEIELLKGKNLLLAQIASLSEKGIHRAHS